MVDEERMVTEKNSSFIPEFNYAIRELYKSIISYLVTGIDDKAQRISNLGHRENIETVLIVKPKKGNFGLLKNFLTQDTDQFKAVEVWEEECQQVKTVVSLNGKNRTFTVGRNQTTALCEIEAPDYIEVQGGLPTPESLNRWFEEIDQEFTRSLYKP